jgi:hypothetical protein
MTIDKFLKLSVLFILSFGSPSIAIACVSSGHVQLSYHCSVTTVTQGILNVVFGTLARPRQIAVVSGIGKYKRLTDSEQLPPADYDVDNIAGILTDKLHFDEVIELKDGNFSRDNLEYVFERYLPNELVNNPKSRVLFAFSGHGADFENTGYIFYSDTTTISPIRYDDLDEAISMDKLKAILLPTIERSQQFLALINSCYGGYFLTESAFVYSGTTLDEPGAHAITAGGSKDKVMALPNVGSGKGSVFFEMVAAALNGSDVMIGTQKFENPARDSGILTTTKLASFLNDAVSKIEEYHQTTHVGSIVPVKSGREGEFFFITNPDRARDTVAARFPTNAQAIFGLAQSNFSKDFQLPSPDANLINPNLITADKVIGIAYTVENDKPWARKTLFRSPDTGFHTSQGIQEPRAVIVKNRLFLHFVVLSYAAPWVASLYEMDAIEGNLYKIDEETIKTGVGSCFD